MEQMDRRLVLSARTCNDVYVRVEVLAKADGRAVPLEPIPELLLDGGRATQSIQSNHLLQSTRFTPVLLESHTVQAVTNGGLPSVLCALSQPRTSG